ncbi:MAG: hypothetical protein WD051_06600, partial [Steroidobacteraceae bacterium]
MKIDRHAKRIALALSAVIVLVGWGNAFGARLSALNATAVSRTSDIREIERAANGRLLAIGRLDRISASNFAVSVLGHDFRLTAGQANYRFVDHAQVGRPVVLFGEFDGANYLVDAAIVLDGQYVQGASKVYLLGSVDSVNRKLGAISMGSLSLDASSFVYQASISRLDKGSRAAILGTQPAIAGRILVESVGLVGRPIRPNASLGTGRPDASVGTGRPNASVGTGRSDASVGTGRPNASVGTGRSDAS